MKKVILALSLSLALSGCANLMNAFDVVTGATVSPQAVIIADNSFDALEATVTNYLKLTKCSAVSGPVCRDPVASSKLIPAIRSARIARNNLKSFFKANPGKLGPSGLYDALQASLSTISSIINQYNIGVSK